MKKINEIFNKNKVSCITAIVVIIVGIILLLTYTLVFNNQTIKELNESAYSIKYDKTWKVTQKKTDKIIFKHNSGSKVTINLIELTDDYKYSSIDEMIDEIIYNIQNQNKEYNLISNTKDKITKLNFDGYKLLYEDKKEQVMLTTYKKNDKLIVIIYEAKDEYFDILLDSVNNIIYNIDIKDEKFDLVSSMKLETEKIEFSSDNSVDKLINDIDKYEIANNNYNVEYSIPSSFQLKYIDSSSGHYDLKIDDDSEIEIKTMVFNYNMYQYLEKDNTAGIYGKYTYYQDKEGYYDFKESLDKLESDYDSYIYKNSFNCDKTGIDKNFKMYKYKQLRETVMLIYALDNNHMLTIEIESHGVPITKKLVNSIKINSSNNYSSFVKINKEDNNLIAELKQYKDYNRDKVEIITLKVPDKYSEINEYHHNIYEERDFVINYNEDYKVYDYRVHYETSKLSKDSIINNLNSSIKSYASNDEYNNLKYSKDLTLNGKKFLIYDGNYNRRNAIMFKGTVTYKVNKKVLIYEIDEHNCIYIEIDGNGKEITDNMLEELTNFTIEIKDYKKE